MVPIPCHTLPAHSASCSRISVKLLYVLHPPIIRSSSCDETRSSPELKYLSHNFGTTLSTIFLAHCLLQATISYQVILTFLSCSCSLLFVLECSLYFNHTLYRGNRVSKASSYDLNAFHSPNFPPLVNGARTHISSSQWS